MDLYQQIIKPKEDAILFEAGILADNGRLTAEGKAVFIDLLFCGYDLVEARKKIIQEATKNLKNKS